MFVILTYNASVCNNCAIFEKLGIWRPNKWNSAKCKKCYLSYQYCENTRMKFKSWRIKVHFRFYDFMNSCWDVNRPFCSLIFAPSWYYNWGAHAWTLYRQNDRNLACSYFYILFVFYASLPNLIKLLPVIDNNTSLHLCSGN